MIDKRLLRLLGEKYIFYTVGMMVLACLRIWASRPLSAGQSILPSMLLNIVAMRSFFCGLMYARCLVLSRDMPHPEWWAI